MEGFHGDIHMSELMLFDRKLIFYLNMQAKMISQRVSDYFSFPANLPGGFFFKHHHGKLPEVGQKALSFLPVHEIPAIPLDQSDGPNLSLHLSRWAFSWMLFNPLPGAEFFNRALRTSRLAGNADQSAQVHQRLVEIRCSPRGNELLDGVFQPLLLMRDLFSLAQDAVHDSLNVAVERGYGFMESNAGHCSGDVRTKSGEGKEILLRRGDHAGMS